MMTADTTASRGRILARASILKDGDNPPRLLCTVAGCPGRLVDGAVVCPCADGKKLAADRITDARIAEIRAGLDGVTPGPWIVSRNPKKWVDTIGPAAPNCWADNRDADAAHIARLDPDTVRAILDRLEAAEASNRRQSDEIARLSGELGEARGMLDASENYNLIAGWEERAERAEAALATARNGALEEAAAAADQWKRHQDVLLRCGEMTAQEMRTALAVAGGIAAAIRALKGGGHG